MYSSTTCGELLPLNIKQFVYWCTWINISYTNKILIDEQPASKTDIYSLSYDPLLILQWVCLFPVNRPTVKWSSWYKKNQLTHYIRLKILHIVYLRIN